MEKVFDTEVSEFLNEWQMVKFWWLSDMQIVIGHIMMISSGGSVHFDFHSSVWGASDC